MKQRGKKHWVKVGVVGILGYIASVGIKNAIERRRREIKFKEAIDNYGRATVEYLGYLRQPNPDKDTLAMLKENLDNVFRDFNK